MKNKGFGLAIAFVLALCAMLLGTFFPIIGSSVFALILGIVLNEFVDLPENSRPGLNWSGLVRNYCSIRLSSWDLACRLRRLPLQVCLL